MTVSSSTSRVSYSGNGSTTAFSVTYYFLDNDHLKVISRAANGTETVKTITTDYTVTGAGNPAGGTVTMLTAPLAGTSLVIVRNVPITQEVDYQGNDPFPAETHEEALDKLTQIVQQQQSAVDRSIKFAETDSTSLSAVLPASSVRAGKVLGFDANGELDVSNSLVGVQEVADIAEQVVALSGITQAIEDLDDIKQDIEDLNAIGSDISTLAAKATEIGTIGDDLAGTGWAYDFGSVADVASGASGAAPDGYIVTVYNNLADITTVANDLNEPVSEIETVGTNIANVNSVGTNIANVNTVASNLGGTNTIGTVAGSIANVNAVGGSIANVNTVAGDIADVNTVAADIADVSTVAADIADVRHCRCQHGCWGRG